MDHSPERWRVYIGSRSSINNINRQSKHVKNGSRYILELQADTVSCWYQSVVKSQGVNLITTLGLCLASVSGFNPTVPPTRKRKTRHAAVPVHPEATVKEPNCVERFSKTRESGVEQWYFKINPAKISDAKRKTGLLVRVQSAVFSPYHYHKTNQTNHTESVKECDVDWSDMKPITWHMIW